MLLFSQLAVRFKVKGLFANLINVPEKNENGRYPAFFNSRLFKHIPLKLNDTEEKRTTK